MIDRRRCPRPALPSIKRPSESGPRCAMASVIFLTRSALASPPLSSIIPAIPHILFYGVFIDFFVAARDLFCAEPPDIRQSFFHQLLPVAPLPDDRQDTLPDGLNIVGVHQTGRPARYLFHRTEIAGYHRASRGLRLGNR